MSRSETLLFACFGSLLCHCYSAFLARSLVLLFTWSGSVTSNRQSEHPSHLGAMYLPHDGQTFRPSCMITISLGPLHPQKHCVVIYEPRRFCYSIFLACSVRLLFATGGSHHLIAILRVWLCGGRTPLNVH